MKKMLTLSVITGLLVSLSFAQFTTGTKSVSSVFSYSSSKAHKDITDATTTMTINPTGSYFVIDNIAVDVSIDISSQKTGSADPNKWTNIGFGGSYYYPLETGAAYGGLGLLLGSITPAGATDATKQNLINIKAGYLHGFTENWYFDVGLRYNMQMGKSKTGSVEGTEGASNMWLGVGLATFF